MNLEIWWFCFDTNLFKFEIYLSRDLSLYQKTYRNPLVLGVSSYLETGTESPCG